MQSKVERTCTSGRRSRQRHAKRASAQLHVECLPCSALLFCSEVPTNCDMHRTSGHCRHLLCTVTLVYVPHVHGFDRNSQPVSCQPFFLPVCLCRKRLSPAFLSRFLLSDGALAGAPWRHDIMAVEQSCQLVFFICIKHLCPS